MIKTIRNRRRPLAPRAVRLGYRTSSVAADFDFRSTRKRSIAERNAFATAYADEVVFNLVPPPAPRRA
jgi:hypothetical protein